MSIGSTARACGLPSRTGDRGFLRLHVRCEIAGCSNGGGRRCAVCRRHVCAPHGVRLAADHRLAALLPPSGCVCTACQATLDEQAARAAAMRAARRAYRLRTSGAVILDLALFRDLGRALYAADETAG